ncbi:MAG TPA: PAM68 family protein [Kamptonema sp.]|nr:PAM68 family protein [Kamptonema sp.]
MSSESPKERLPFEPAKKTKKKPKAPPEPQVKAAEDTKQPSTERVAMAIPEVVSKRMIRRMALFCGVPTAGGMATFIASYLVVSKGWLPLPNSAVVLLSMGFLGLGVLGLSYGVLSASWDEENPGSKLGWEEFTTNFGRMRAAWRSQQPKS